MLVEIAAGIFIAIVAINILWFVGTMLFCAIDHVTNIDNYQRPQPGSGHPELAVALGLFMFLSILAWSLYETFPH